MHVESLGNFRFMIFFCEKRWAGYSDRLFTRIFDYLRCSNIRMFTNNIMDSYDHSKLERKIFQTCRIEKNSPLHNNCAVQLKWLWRTQFYGLHLKSRKMLERIEHSIGAQNRRGEHRRRKKSPSINHTWRAETGRDALSDGRNTAFTSSTT